MYDGKLDPSPLVILNGYWISLKNWQIVPTEIFFYKWDDKYKNVHNESTVDR